MVIVDYAFDTTTTTLAFTSPVSLSIPPQGTLTGDVHVTYTSDAQGNIVNGPATLDLLNLQSDLNINTMFLGQAVTITGPVEADLVDTITCGGALCASINLPAGQPKDFDGSASVPMPVLTVGSLHGSIAGIDFKVGALSILATLNFNASETSRTVPEPAGLALGAASLALMALARHRRV